MADRTVARIGYGLVFIENGGNHHPVHHPVFPFLQTVTQRTLDNIVPAFTLARGPSVEPIHWTPDAGLGRASSSVDRSRSGYVQQWNVGPARVRAEHRDGAGVCRFEDHPVGLPDTNLNQLTVEQLALGALLQQRVPNPSFGTIPRSSSLGDPTIPVGQLMKPYPQHTTVSLSQQRGHDDLQRLTRSWNSASPAACIW